MSAAAEQPTLDLGDYRGRNIVAVKTKLANTNDGFDPNTGGIEGRIYEIGEEITVAVRVRRPGWIGCPGAASRRTTRSRFPCACISSARW